MKKFISIASHPGTTGTTYYNQYFSMLGLDFSYEARGYSNLEDAILELKNIPDLNGISVSMPFKSKVIQYLDIADRSVDLHNSCNTIKISGDVWKGYNTDLAGAIFIKQLVKETDSVSILGNGAMAAMIRKTIAGTRSCIFARSLGNWDKRHETTATVIINATALGTVSDESPFVHVPSTARLVVDLAIKPNILEKQCQVQGVAYIGGIEFYKRQFLEQFRIYCSIDPDPEIFDQITFSRSLHQRSMVR